MATGVKIIVLIIMTISLLACSTKESESVRTDQIYLAAEVDIGKDEWARVRVDLQYQDIFGKPIKLSDNETLSVYYNGQQLNLVKDHDLLGIDYEVSFDTHGDGGEFTLIFDRYNGEHHTYTVRIPQPFSIKSPGSSRVIHGDEEVVIRWNDPSPIGGDVVVLDGKLRCLSQEHDYSVEHDNEHESWEFIDSGSLVFPIGKLVSNLKLEVAIEWEELVKSHACELSFWLNREFEEKLTPIFSSGSKIQTKFRQGVEEMTYWLED